MITTPTTSAMDTTVALMINLFIPSSAGVGEGDDVEIGVVGRGVIMADEGGPGVFAAKKERDYIH